MNDRNVWQVNESSQLRYRRYLIVRFPDGSWSGGARLATIQSMAQRLSFIGCGRFVMRMQTQTQKHFAAAACPHQNSTRF